MSRFKRDPAAPHLPVATKTASKERPSSSWTPKSSSKTTATASAPSNTGPLDHWSAWGFEEALSAPNQTIAAPAAPPQLSNAPLPIASPWQWSHCPKCRRGQHPPAVPTLAWHSELGLFWCAQCGYHGNTHVHPSRHKDSWWKIWRTYVQDTAWPTAAPSVFVKDNGEGLLEKGCWAWGWNAKEQAWQWIWHAWITGPQHPTTPDTIVIEDVWMWWPSSAPSTDFPLAPAPTLVDPWVLDWKEKTSWTWLRMPWAPAVVLGASKIAGQHMVLTSRPQDALVLEHAGVSDITCLPPGLSIHLPNDPAWRCLETMEQHLSHVSELVLALPAIKEERLLEEELARRLDRERCYRARWKLSGALDEQHDEDVGAWEALLRHGPDAVATMVNTAAPYPVVGVYELEDIDDRFEELYKTGLVPGVSTAWPSMDPYYTIKTGQWTLVTGIPGHGKSSWLDAVLVNLATHHGWRFGVFSPENQPIERHFASLMEKKLKKPFSEGPRPRITPEEKNQTKGWLQDRFKIILPDEEKGVWTLDAVLALAKKLVLRHGIRGLVIDPWNELDHTRSDRINETNHISESLTKIRRFARLYDVHVWIVAHPTKLEKRPDGHYPVATPYDVSGGAHWRNKADVAVCVYRYVNEADDDITDIYIQKVRFKEVGAVGMVSLRCDRASGAYIDDIDHHLRQMLLGKGEHTPSSSARLSQPRTYRPLPMTDSAADLPF